MLTYLSIFLFIILSTTDNMNSVVERPFVQKRYRKLCTPHLYPKKNKEHISLRTPDINLCKSQVLISKALIVYLKHFVCRIKITAHTSPHPYPHFTSFVTSLHLILRSSPHPQWPATAGETKGLEEGQGGGLIGNIITWEGAFVLWQKRKRIEEKVEEEKRKNSGAPIIYLLEGGRKNINYGLDVLF